ncbi:hypothetical protein [Loigolactobacillus jiayinensis]|uniref:WxL domain-containing protein n=1 Tax=Loigolactobacillus jiayinensis TaxID=2486016 RepID=A0ABW1RF62_9LACO|nr:hypothetical protein [Loigolactobacillus jiayinensis]
MRIHKLVLLSGLLAVFTGLGISGTVSAAGSASTGQFTVSGDNIEPLRLESVPQFKFERVALSRITDASVVHTPHTTVESTVADDRGHLVVADERTASARDASGWQVNAQLNVVALVGGNQELENVEMLVNFAGNGGSAIINDQASPVWQNKPTGTDTRQAFARDVDQGRLIIPQQNNSTLAGQYSAHVTWTLTDSIDMQEVDQS